jgi:hypothetical protein
MKIVETDTLIHIPGVIAKCPYCGDFLTSQSQAWAKNRKGNWIATEIEMECVSAPGDEEFDDYLKWEAWCAQHTYMPYVYWVPVEKIVLRWLNENYRWDVKRRHNKKMHKTPNRLLQLSLGL